MGTSDPSQTTIRVLLNDGAGSFADAPALRVATGPAPQALALADLDGDGDLDLVVGNGPAVAAGNLKVFLNDVAGPSGLLGASPAPGSPSSVHDVGADVRALATGNLDDDVAPANDLVVLSAAGGEILLANNDAAGTLRALAGSAFPGGLDPVALAVADLNFDFFDDWVVADAGGNAVAILLNDQGTGIGIGQSQGAGLEPRAVVAADLDADGRADLATADAAGGSVTLLRNTTGSGVCPGSCFATAAAFPAGLRPAALIAARPSAAAAVQLFVADAQSADVVALRSDGATGLSAPLRLDGAATSEAIALGSLNADALPDAVTADLAGDRLQLWLGLPGGAFAPPIDVALAAGAAPVDVAIGDVDGDGSADVAAALEGAGQLALLRGTGAGALSAPELLATGPLPEVVLLADLDADGLPDLITADMGADQLTVRLSAWTGAFDLSFALPTGLAPRGVAAADLDGHGCLDLVSADSGAASLSIFHCDPANPGQFFAAVTTQPSAEWPAAVAAADLDADGDVDLIVTHATGAQVLLGLGLGYFDAGEPIDAPPAGRQPAVADLDLDGRPDLVFADGAAGTVSVARGLGGGRFGPAQRHATGGEPRDVAIGNLDGDGRPDVVGALATPAGSLVGGGVAVLPSRCLP